MKKFAEYIADLFRENVRRGEIRIRIRQEDRGEGVNLNLQCRLTGRVSQVAAVRALSQMIDDTAKAAGIPTDEFWVKCWQARGKGQEV